MTLKLLDIVIEALIKALNDGTLIQKQARLCDFKMQQRVFVTTCLRSK